MEARTQAHPQNAGSLGVSFALGYEESCRMMSTPTAGHAVPRACLRLPRERWAQRHSTPVEVVGLGSCREMFGVD